MRISMEKESPCETGCDSLPHPPSLTLSTTTQLELIQEFGDGAVPALWAGFVVVGDGQPSH